MKKISVMSKEEKKKGRCAICGKECLLTFEHIPPRASNNNKPVRNLTFESYNELLTSEERIPWERGDLQYIQLQKGNGLYSLCERCNNLTGHYYADEYSNIANEISYFMINKLKEDNNIRSAELKIKLHPSIFAKQVLSMFCSTTPGLHEKYPEIKNILLNKDAKEEHCNFKISMYLLKTQIIETTGPISVCYGEDFKIRTYSIMNLFPFGFVFDYDNKIIDSRYLDISSFLNYSYDDLLTMVLPLNIFERNMPLAFDYRTKEEYLNSIEKAYDKEP